MDFYTSHEALNLLYEQPLTRKAADGKYYDLSTHFPWIGMRTAQLDGAHADFFRGIAHYRRKDWRKGFGRKFIGFN